MDVHLTEEERIRILNSEDLYGIMQRILLRENKIDQDREHFWVVGLQNNNRILFIELVSMGSVNQTIAEPMEVFSLALQKRAVKIVLVHNHPSGELQPSASDKDLTDRLIQVGLIVNTPVIDHLIISEKSYLSFMDTGILRELEQSSKWVPEYNKKKHIKEQAEKIGALIEKKKIAKILLEEKESVERIAKITGLSVEEIQSLG